jgi:hypothetical protein
MSDNFGETLDDTVGRDSKYRKTEFLSLKPGEYVLRILDSKETRKEAHYLPATRTYVECLGDDCPLCQSNRKILYEHPEDYRDQKDWCPRRPRFYLNVMDKADNVVKVLSSGPRLIEDLKTMSKAVRNEQDERIDIRNYDWVLTVKGEGREKDITPTPRFFGKETSPEYGEQQLYDLDNCLVKLEADEMLDAFAGASLKDIFAVRRAKKEIINSEFSPSEDLNGVVSESVDELFQ